MGEITPKISVIIPVYKVEPYLRKCLDSVVGQTYTNLEIILVDDGSPDNCGAICDEYAARDERIRVIHQSNGGVSAARNAGLSVATGEWIGWVDSDDWIEPEMFRCMLEKALQLGTDIVVCSRAEVMQGRLVPRCWEAEAILSREAALELLLEDNQMQNYLWDKLWRRDLFDGITFPIGRSFEDIAVMHQLFVRSQRVLVLPQVMYYYLQRSTGIVADQTIQSKINHYLAAKERMESLWHEWPQFRTLLEAQCVSSAVGIWCSYYANPKERRRQTAPQLREIAEFAAAHGDMLQCRKGLGLAGRIVVRLIPYDTWWSFALARCVGWVYKVKHGRYL